MDKINVNDMALRNSYNALQQLNTSSKSIMERCVSTLMSQIDRLDSDFRNDIEKYIEQIIGLQGKLNICIEENMIAIRERLCKVPDYENKIYRKRNIV